MHDDWLAMLAREGTAIPLGAGPMTGDDPDADPPCPACGTAAPPVAGECSECGLFLG